MSERQTTDLSKRDYLLTVLSEECSEVIKAVTKSMRFGLDNYHPDTPELTNENELIGEYYQLQATMEMLQDAGFVRKLSDGEIQGIKDAKKAKVRSYLPKNRSVTICISHALADTVDAYLRNTDPEQCQRDDETVTVTAVFDDGMEMDIKCVGSHDGPSYTEAVLFDHGCEVAVTEVSEEFVGPWEIQHNGETYQVKVEVLDDHCFVAIPDDPD